MYSYQRTPMENPYASPIYWVFLGYSPQESLENTINTMGTLLGVRPIVPWLNGRHDIGQNPVAGMVEPLQQTDGIICHTSQCDILWFCLSPMLSDTSPRAGAAQHSVSCEDKFASWATFQFRNWTVLDDSRMLYQVLSGGFRLLMLGIKPTGLEAPSF